MSSSHDNKTEKSKQKLKIFDFLVILIIVFMIGFSIFWATPLSQGLKTRTSSTVALEYTVEIRNVEREFLDKISEGNTVVDGVSNTVIGTVIAIDPPYESQILSVNESGQGILVDVPDRYNLIVTISSTAASYRAGSGYSVNSCRIAVGESLDLRFPDYVGTGYCIGFRTQS